MKALLLALVLTAAAVGVHLTTPSEVERTAPFVEEVALDEWASTRTFAAEATEVRRAAEVTDGEWTGTTGGVWVVVTVTARTAVEPATLEGALLVDGLSFAASQRTDAVLSGEVLAPGLARRGDYLFELPAAALDGAEDVRLRLSRTQTPRLDGVVDVPLDVPADAEPLVELTPVERVLGR